MRNKSTVLVLCGLLMIAAAVGLTCYNLYDSRRAGESSGEVLSDLKQYISSDPIPPSGRPGISYRTPENEVLPSEIEYPDYVLNPDMNMPVQEINGYGYIGMLSVPTLGLELPVMDTWDYARLRIAPCRYTGSAYLDNMTICAHNYNRHFGQLRNLSLGDPVVFTDMDGNVFHYQVAEVDILQPVAIDEMTKSDWELSLFTCTVGGRTRVTVRCSREKDPLPYSG